MYSNSGVVRLAVIDQIGKKGEKNEQKFSNLFCRSCYSETRDRFVCDLPMSSLVFASISPNRVSGLAIDFSSSQE